MGPDGAPLTGTRVSIHSFVLIYYRGGLFLSTDGINQGPQLRGATVSLYPRRCKRGAVVEGALSAGTMARVPGRASRALVISQRYVPQPPLGVVAPLSVELGSR